MLKVTNLRKEFTTVVAVDDVSLEVKRGEIFGLLGPNGAGKTTTIRVILNIITPDRGEITFGGKPFSPEIQKVIGYLPEERGLYRKSTVMNTILYFAELRGMPRSDAKQRATNWLKRFDLAGKSNSKVEELSKGNQQKVQIITAILHDPDLLILDEPFSGLDPVNQILLKDIFLELKKNGKALIFSTHQMEQAEKMCERITLINKGRVVLDGELREIRKRFGKNAIRVEYNGDGAFLQSLPIVKKALLYENYAEVELQNSTMPNEFLHAITDKLDIRSFQFIEPSLNSIFLETVGGDNDHSNGGTRQ
ncbi:MAG: ABC transporter ATP-binding protein [Bacteroidota bacterium]